MRITLVILFGVVAARGVSAQSLDRLLFEDADTPMKAPSTDMKSKAPSEPAPTDAGPNNHDIRWQLRLVHAQLQAENVDNATVQLQRDILSRLKALRQGNLQSPTVENAEGSPDNAGQNSASKTDGTPGSSPGSLVDNAQDRDAKHAPGDSGEEKGITGNDDAQQLESEILDRAWGHFPPETIERLRASGAHEFLPTYRDKIQAYFKRLGDLPVDEN